MDEKGAIVVLQMIEAHGKLATKAKELAIISLERHVKKNPIFDKELSSFKCPTCKHIFDGSSEFCPDCGQAIDWKHDSHLDWISMDKLKPQPYMTYLVTDGDNIFISTYLPKVGFLGEYEFSDEGEGIIAWMELPEPYQKEGDSNGK